MAKRIKGVKVLNSYDVNKNSGIKISHTISKIKEHEARYTVILTSIFMVVIVVFCYFAFRFDEDSLTSIDYTKAYSHLSASGRVVYINQRDIMSDEAGLKNTPVSVNFSNMTNHTINYVIRFAKEESMIENCKCEIVDYKKIKFSVDGKNVQSFDNEDMIVTTGMIKSNKEGTLDVHFWIDDEVDSNSDCNFYGKFIFDEFNEMKIDGAED